MKPMGQTLSCVLIVIGVIGVLAWIKDRAPVPHGIFLATQNEMTQPTQTTLPVHLYTQLPRQAEIIGYINVMMHFTRTNQASHEQQLQDYVLQLAAQHGATAVVIDSVWVSTGAMPLASYRVRARAIKE